MPSFADAMVLTGPTGSGKSALALRLAPRLNAEIVSMDSMTLYRGMDIGTAKPSREERSLVPHHLIDVLDPWESSNVAWWLDRAAAVCEDLRTRGKRPLFVGGTPFYLRAMISGLFEAPKVPPEVRQKWEVEADRLGNPTLHIRLAEIDPIAAKRIHPNDRRRIVRALEVFDATGRPISDWQTTWSTPGFRSRDDGPVKTPRCLCLTWPRELLYDRIDRRVAAMMDAGWRDECRRLLDGSHPPGREASQALGYRELFDDLRQPTRTTDELIALIQQKTRQFAKRQLTWFRGIAECRFLEMTHVTDDGVLDAFLSS